MPERTVIQVLYDQDCGICTKTARVLRAIDRRRRLELVGFADAERRGLASDVPRDVFERSFHAIVDGRTVSGAAAIPFILERLPMGAGAAAAIRRLPPVERATRRIYDWIAANRFRFSDSCACDASSPIPPGTHKEGERSPDP